MVLGAGFRWGPRSQLAAQGLVDYPSPGADRGLYGNMVFWQASDGGGGGQVSSFKGWGETTENREQPLAMEKCCESEKAEAGKFGMKSCDHLHSVSVPEFGGISSNPLAALAKNLPRDLHLVTEYGTRCISQDVGLRAWKASNARHVLQPTDMSPSHFRRWNFPLSESVPPGMSLVVCGVRHETSSIVIGNEKLVDRNQCREDSNPQVIEVSG